MSKIVDYTEYMSGDCKVYVEVYENRRIDGSLIPLSLVWENGTRYAIDQVVDIRPAASLKAGGVGIRYTVRVRNRETYMFLEEEKGVYRWFMERK